ncbi:MAG: PilZ domain-containing protein [Candidatus Thiodiazotropha sp. (ex Lucinoma kastoroae)]|nr:PilZ domain-containing protein [Candidatus Thiodiazotropha sp. (ex Rostrolucina anterorostrata)]MCU7847692.1 PilZ domain-containing protein [Candidatus Thiodiazotropha sp. (ex Lucinoma kastoroae)]MCU7859926.1 PilZ domain-containing protein [Candidatus Thiodiazotropha sp. (ex Lucinoma kastoroae)]
MNDFTEKRDYHRMAVEGEVRFRIDGENQVSSGIVKNLSSTGLLMSFEKEMAPGTKLIIMISPDQTITPPLSAKASVIRSDRLNNDQFTIACTIDRILAESEIEIDLL